jgi:hypothetical protein
MNREGAVGAMSIREGFQYAVAAGGANELIDAAHIL